MLKRFLVCMLALVLLLSCFAGCKNENGKQNETGNNDQTTEAPDDEETDPDDEWNYIYDDVPTTLDYGGTREFKMLVRSEEPYCNEFNVFESSSIVLNQAVYTRNDHLEDRLGIVLTVETEPGNVDAKTSFFNRVENVVTAGGSDMWNVIAGYARYMAPQIAKGLFLDLNELEYVDLTKEYWNQSIVEQFTINDNLYVVTGDVSPQLIGQSVVMFENLAVAETYSVPSVYELVDNKQWTHEKMLELVKMVYYDNNGNTREDKADTFGLAMPLNAQVDAYYASYRLPITEKDANGDLKFTFEKSRVIDVYERIFDLLVNNTSNVWAKKDYSDDEGSDYLQMFMEGRALFTANRLYTVTTYLTDMEDQYAILPYPMYDEQQGDYYTYSWDQYSLLGVPSKLGTKSEDELEFTGAVLEVMASLSQNIVTPAYYETALKYRYSPNEESSRMLDYITDNIYIEFLYLETSSAIYFLRLRIQDDLKYGMSTVSSKYESNATTFKTQFEEIFETWPGNSSAE